MASLIAFQPNRTSFPPFQQNVTLDGVAYNMATAWNISRGDWYVSLTDQSGNLIRNQPLIGSPPAGTGTDLPLFPGLLVTSQIVYRPSTGNFEISP